MRRTGKVCFVLLVLMSLLTAVPLSSSKAAALSEVKLGVLLPMSGGSAFIGKQIYNGLQFAVEKINAEGGIKSLGGAKIKLVLADTATKAETAVAEAERLVVREKVNLITGCYNSGITLPASAVGEKYKVPWVLMFGNADSIAERGFKYIVRPANSNAIVFAAGVRAIKALNEKASRKLTKAVLVYEDSEWGQNLVNPTKESLPSIGVDVVGFVPYPAKVADMGPLVTKIKSQKPDLVIQGMYIGDMLLFMRTAAELKLDTTFFSIGAGSAEGDYLKSAGVNAEYQFGMSGWIPGAIKTKPPAMVQRIEEFEKRFGPSDEGTIYSQYILEFIRRSLEGAASVEADKLIQAMLKVEIKYEDTVAPLSLKFGTMGKQTNVNLLGDIIVAQVHKGQWHMTHPVTEPGFTPFWPAPKWSERR
jgi:branched-chain amino acid transport system substrate-binding protein